MASLLAVDLQRAGRQRNSIQLYFWAASSWALLAAVGIALLVGIGHARITPRLVRLTSSSCGLALIGCGLMVGYTIVLT